MQYGICGGPEIWPAAASAGFDYIEWSVGALLKPRDDRQAFAEALEQVRSAELPCPVVNCFVPGDMKITGDQADRAALVEYATTAFHRGRDAGVSVIVFGSGGARRIPDGFDSDAAHRQLVDFGRAIAPIALDNGITVAVEPLNRSECNVLTTVGRCAALVREVDHPAVRLLVDAYHLLMDGDRVEAVAENGDLLAHVHIATTPNRLAPGAEGCEFGPFFSSLARCGFDGRISIEGKIPDPAVDLPRALSHMKRLTVV